MSYKDICYLGREESAFEQRPPLERGKFYNFSLGAIKARWLLFQIWYGRVKKYHVARLKRCAVSQLIGPAAEQGRLSGLLATFMSHENMISTPT